MSDEELIAQLRSMHWCVTTLDNGVGVSNSTVAVEAADRIEELEAKLDDAIRSGKDWFEQQKKAHDRAVSAEAKLTAAIEALDEAVYLLKFDENDMDKRAGVYRIVTTIREMKGKL